MVKFSGQELVKKYIRGFSQKLSQTEMKCEIPNSYSAILKKLNP